MKTLLRALAPFALMAAVGSTPSNAADLYTKGPAYAATPFNVYNWNGFYVGANVGYQSATVTNWPSNGPSGVAGGVQAGYNWQVAPNWVLGAEADIQGSSASDTFAGFQFSNPWFGTVRGRVGYAFNNILVYGTGGFAYGGGSVTRGGFSNSQTHTGWTLGAGVEVGLTPNWSAKAEYLYIRLNDQGYVLTGFNNGFQSNLIRLGVNYRF